MKKLALIAFAAISTSVFAQEIVIDGNSVQAVAATSSIFLNAADGANAYAQQNVSSNSGEVTVESGGLSVQLTAADNSVLANIALGDNAYASQNVSSNIGDVTIGASANSLQLTALSGSGAINLAGANTKAVQNIASNNGCVACE